MINIVNSNKILVLLSIIMLPIGLLAQTKSVPKEIKKPEPEVTFSYLIMETEEIKSKKKSPSINFKFTANSNSLSQRLSNEFKNEDKIIFVINTLGKKGWKLVSVERNKYFFEMSRNKYRRR